MPARLPENNESARLNARAPQGGEFFTVGLELVSTPLPACFRVLAPCPCQWRWNSVEISIRRGWAWSKPRTMYLAQPSKQGGRQLKRASLWVQNPKVI